MSATILTPVTAVCTTSFADITVAPATGKVRKLDIRAANVGAADATVSLTITDGTTTINRLATYPVPFNSSGSAPDLELGLMLPAGWKARAKASAGSTIEVSVTGIEADVTDFA